jgi:hypothetical protein
MDSGLRENHERVAGDHLAVDDAGAVEAGGFDAPDQRHQRGHRRGAGNAHVYANRLGHARLLWRLTPAGSIAYTIPLFKENAA